MNNWRGEDLVGSLRRLRDGDPERIGHCWAKGRLRVGDLVLFAHLSGDCFYTCYLVDEAPFLRAPDLSQPLTGLKRIPVSFGMYASGSAVKITEQTYHLLMADQLVELPRLVD